MFLKAWQREFLFSFQFYVVKDYWEVKWQIIYVRISVPLLNSLSEEIPLFGSRWMSSKGTYLEVSECAIWRDKLSPVNLNRMAFVIVQYWKGPNFQCFNAFLSYFLTPVIYYALLESWPLRCKQIIPILMALVLLVTRLCLFLCVSLALQLFALNLGLKRLISQKPSHHRMCQDFPFGLCPVFLEIAQSWNWDLKTESQSVRLTWSIHPWEMRKP